MRNAIFIFCLALSAGMASAQTTVNYSFDTAADGIYLVERMEKTIPNNPRKQTVETPLFLRDTSGVSGYLASLKQRKNEVDAQVRAGIAESDFLRAKINVLSGMADSLFFKPKTVAKQ